MSKPNLFKDLVSSIVSTIGGIYNRPYNGVGMPKGLARVRLRVNKGEGRRG
jgi:hypothetical protein